MDFTKDKLCHHLEDWLHVGEDRRRECLSPDTHPYMFTGIGMDHHIYYFCDSHGPVMSCYRQLTPEEALLFEIMES